MTALLQMDSVCKSFGAITVAEDLTFDVAKGQALGVLGPNGAGKTSMFNLITGTLQASAGRITFDGRDITRQSAAKRCRAGMSRSFQVPQPFAGLTIFENAMIAATQAGGLSGREAELHCLAVLEQTELMDRANTRAGSLTLLGRKRLELTRALCTKPRLLLLDEIAGGLTEAECGALVQTIKDIHADGVTIIWIEHVVHALLAVVDKLMVIDFGRKIAEGEPRPIMESPEVQQIYLGIDNDA